MKKLVPFGDRILVRRKKVGEKLWREGIIVAPDSTKDAETDLAVVVDVPKENNFYVGNQNRMSFIREATLKVEGIEPFIKVDEYLSKNAWRLLKPGDEVMLSRSVGIKFQDTSGQGEMTLVKGEDIIGKVEKDGE